jgi:hypothetical protein
VQHEKMMTTTSAPKRLILTIATAILLCALPGFAQQHTLRDLSGTVTDQSHEPIRGAVVQLQNSGSDSVMTYLTDAKGQYEFKRLDGESDYTVWVVYRNRHTPSRSISKFDSHLQKVIDFEIKSY